MKNTTKTYKVIYEMECFVEAENEDEAMEKYGDGEGEDCEYVRFVSIHEMTGKHFILRLATEDKPKEGKDD